LARIPFPDNAEIVILNVISAPFCLNIPETLYPKINERIVEIETRAREMELKNSERIIGQARDYFARGFSKVDVLSAVGDPSTEILRAAESAGSRIIAVGCRGMRGLKGIMGSVSRNVLTHARCSILIGKMCKDQTSL
jgi:nucleotide-binding universal stress UspA family protein